MATNLCFACGEPIEGTLKKFHDDKCKDKYYSEKRAIERAHGRIRGALVDLDLIRDQSKATDNRVFASNVLVKVKNEANDFIGTKWKCANCGDEITSSDKPSLNCRKCGNKEGFINMEAHF